MMNLRFAPFSFLLSLCTVMSSSVQAQQTMPDDTKQFRITITSGMNTFFDETMLYFEAGVPAYDQFDVVKPPMSTTGAPQIASLSVDGAPMIMNSFGSITQPVSIPLRVKAGVTGTHYLKFYDGEGFMGATCIRLEDTDDGSIVRMQEGDSIAVFLDASTPVDPPRFNLLIGTTNSFAKQDISCFAFSDGEIAIIGGDTGPWNYSWYGPGNIFLHDHLNHNGVSKLNNASPGIYRIDIAGTNYCGVQSTFIELTEPPMIEAQFDIQGEHCTLVGDGSIEVTGTGGVPPFSYLWTGGQSGSTIDDLSAGFYAVNLTDSVGCMRYFQNIEVGITGEPEVLIVPSSDFAAINEPIDFANDNDSGDSYFWDFGDGTTSIEQEPSHAFASIGRYDVMLILEDQGCVDTGFVEINVGPNGITDVGPFRDVRLWHQDGMIHVQGDEYVLDQATISMIDMGGRIVLADQRVGTTRQFPVTIGTSGVYRAILSNPAGRRAYPVTIIR